MTGPLRLASWHRSFPGLLAGSVYAVDSPRRVDAAGVLAAAGHDIHVDVMDDADGVATGVDVDALAEIMQRVPSARVGVHLIGSGEFVTRQLPRVLSLKPGTVFLPWSSFTAAHVNSVRASGSAAWIALWDEWNGRGTPHWPAEPDGVLVMLIAPGTRNAADAHRLGLVSECARSWPVTVDGGVTEELAALCITAGARSLVVGRALLTSNLQTS